MAGLAAAAALAYACLVGVRLWQRAHAFTPVARPFGQPLARPAAQARPGTPGPLTSFQRSVVTDLERQVRAEIRYEDGYYTGGDPPPQIGVCVDVVIRSYRAAGVDLRRLLARDVAQAGRAYRIARPDANIDHRRCRNLIVFFRRQARELPSEGLAADWQPGDVVFWSTRGDGETDHVGVIGCDRDATGQPAVVHHWPGMLVAETDGLHRFEITGHFRWPARGDHRADHSQGA